jgi:tetratricopeptide (TPR) repeat protein
MGGVGKTALAVHWANQVADRFPDGQLYANLRGFDPSGAPATPGEAVRAFLSALQVPVDQIPPGLAEQAGLYRSVLAGRRMLIVLDNARDPAQARPLLPGGGGCLVVITSRSLLAGLAATEGARLIDLGMLSEDEAAEMLARRLGQDRVVADPGAVAELAGLCGRLPLALAITAARGAARPGFPLAALAAELRDERSRLDALDAGEEAASIRAVFSWSYNSLPAPVAGLFRLLGLHPGPDISGPAAASLAGLPPAEARRLLDQLAGAGLLTTHSPDGYVFHDLLHAYAAEHARTLDPGAGRSAAIRRFLDYCLYTAIAGDRLLNPQRDPVIPEPLQPDVTPADLADSAEAMAWFDREHKVLLAAVALAVSRGLDNHAWLLAWAMATFLDIRACWHEWADVARAALAAAQRLGDAVAEAAARRGLSHACIRLGRYADADDHLEQALRLYAGLGDRLGQARVHHDISWAYAKQGRDAEGLAHQEQALELSRAAGSRTSEAKALNGMGWHLAHLGSYQQALAVSEQALGMWRELRYRYEQAHVWDSLGYVHGRLGDHARAMACYRYAVGVYRELGQRYQEARTLARLGDTCHAANQAAAARDARRQALAILNDLRHPDAEQVRIVLRQPDATVSFGD